MRVPKIYIDTSVISYLDNAARPDWVSETLHL